MVLTVSFALSPVIGLFCHRHRRNYFRQLDAGVEASGPHDFAVRKSALSSAAPPTSTASRPASVTIASRPSVGRDGSGYRSDLGRRRTKIFLQRGMDSRPTEQPVGQISRSPHGQTGRANARSMMNSADAASSRYCQGRVNIFVGVRPVVDSASSFRGARSASPESITTIGDYGFRACAKRRIPE
jgi:hypothetical protein